MSIAEVERAALALPDRERARLALALLETFSAGDADISDEAALQRDADMESGRAEEISHEEFVRRVERERRR